MPSSFRETLDLPKHRRYGNNHFPTICEKLCMACYPSESGGSCARSISRPLWQASAVCWHRWYRIAPKSFAHSTPVSPYCALSAPHCCLTWRSFEHRFQCHSRLLLLADLPSPKEIQLIVLYLVQGQDLPSSIWSRQIPATTPSDLAFQILMDAQIRRPRLSLLRVVRRIDERFS